MKTILLLVKNPSGLVGMILVLAWVVVAVFAPLIAPPPENQRDPYTIKRNGFSSLPSPPSDEAVFGTTSGGYDIFYGIVWGSRTAFRVGLIVVSVTAVVGVLLGGAGAFAGGWVDEIIMRITDLFMAFPFLIGVIVLSIVLGKGLDKVILALVIFTWRRYARVMRSAVLPVKECAYVSAAESLGEGRPTIFFRHILPNSIFPIFVLATLDIGWTVLVAASLSFIGVGAEPGYADWGQMISFSRRWLLGATGDPFLFWYTYVYPSIAILSFVLGFTLLGDTLRDVLDPKMRNVK
jgi:peptide/nickel transport system permease protein